VEQMSNSGVSTKELVTTTFASHLLTSNSTTVMGGETKDTMTSSKEYPKLVAHPVGKKVRT